MAGQTCHLVLPQIRIFYFSNFQGKSINFTTELGSSAVLFFIAAVSRHNGLIEIMRRSTHTIIHTPKISLSFEENKHSGET